MEVARISRSLRAIALAVAAVVVTACGTGTAPTVAPSVASPSGSAPVAASSAPSLDGATTVEQVLAALDGVAPAERAAALLKKAEKEGEFSGYFALQIESADAITSAFLKAYPTLKEQHFALGGGDTLERILTEGTAGQHNWDVAVVNPEHLKPLREANLVGSYRGPVLKDIPTQYQDPGGQWVDLYVIQQGTMINKSLVTEPPKTIEDLAAPRFKGKFTLDTEDFEWGQMVLDQYGDRGRAVLEAIKANQPVLIRGGGDQREAVASGEAVMASTVGDYLVYGQIQDGAPVGLVYLDFNIAKHGPMIISNNAPHPAAAVLFLDWALSVDGQQAMHDSTKRSPVNPGVTQQFPDLTKQREGVKFVSLDLNSFAENYEQIQSTWREIFTGN
jgi:iron(III) transport system substrate-binding protein